MRFHEIEEALPGRQVGLLQRGLSRVGLGNRAARSLRTMELQAKEAYKQWTEVIQRFAPGINMDDPKIYSEVFGKYMSRALKLDVKDPIIQQGIIDMEKQAPVTSPKSVQNLIMKMMGQQRAKSLNVGAADGSATSAPAPKQKGLQDTASDGQTYTWLGAQWKNTKTGRIATRAISAELNGKHP